jgi:Mg/Co/Ni transporter MgtE
MPDKIHSYRQPMVTASGIFLAFILNFSSSWVTQSFDTSSLKNMLIGIGLLIGTVLLIIVIYRILNMKYPKDTAEQYYQTTLRLFIVGLSAAFLGVFLVMLETFFTE